MRFYLNGEDLGTAFLNFTGPEIFPALSLNVRQSVRINFGQYKFQYPPNEVDGKAYQPVWNAAEYPREKPSGFGVKSDGNITGVGVNVIPLRDGVRNTGAGYPNTVGVAVRGIDPYNDNENNGRYEGESRNSFSSTGTGNSSTSTASTSIDAETEGHERESERRISTLTQQAQEELEAKDLDDSDEIEDKEYGRDVGGSLEISRISGHGDGGDDLTADQGMRRELAGDTDDKNGEHDSRVPDRLMTVSKVTDSLRNTLYSTHIVFILPFLTVSLQNRMKSGGIVPQVPN